jgi:hypothetical protein
MGKTGELIITFKVYIVIIGRTWLRYEQFILFCLYLPFFSVFAWLLATCYYQNKNIEIERASKSVTEIIID